MRFFVVVCLYDLLHKNTNQTTKRCMKTITNMYECVCTSRSLHMYLSFHFCNKCFSRFFSFIITVMIVQLQHVSRSQLCQSFHSVIHPSIIIHSFIHFISVAYFPKNNKQKKCTIIRLQGTQCNFFFFFALLYCRQNIKKEDKNCATDYTFVFIFHFSIIFFLTNYWAIFSHLLLLKTHLNANLYVNTYGC